MKILSLDTSTSSCSVAVMAGARILSHRHDAMARGQSERLIPMIAEVMAEAEMSFPQLDLLAVTVGPGTFTGIRIGLATARALHLASGKPLAGVSTCEAIAAGIPEQERQGRQVLVVLDSRRADLWVQRFDGDLTPLSPPAALLPEAIAALAPGPMVVAGDAALLVLSLLPEARLSSGAATPDASVVGRLARFHWTRGTALPATPLYLRPADVTLHHASLLAQP